MNNHVFHEAEPHEYTTSQRLDASGLCNQKCRNIMKLPIYFLLIFILFGSLSGQTLDLQGQAAFWGGFNDSKQSQIGLRYIPTFSVTKMISQKWMLDSEIAWQGSEQWRFEKWNYQSESNTINPYRLWLRLSSDQFEARIGLQKINFGPARMLRSLMWFDRLDPRDPLQLTDGVYGILLKYYFLNNANIWLWGLYGNDDTKGYEILPTRKNSSEFGGRIQYPVHSAELALTVHHRKVNLFETSEDRIAFDGRWDFEIGLWFEMALTRLDWDLWLYKYQKMATLGFDYTFGTGNGLYCQAEHFVLQVSDKWHGPGTTRTLSALSVNYPIGMLDNLSMMIYHDWDESVWYRFINWQQIYDRWQIHFIGFWNPDQFQFVQFQTEQSLWIGKGIQCMVVFNH